MDGQEQGSNTISVVVQLNTKKENCKLTNQIEGVGELQKSQQEALEELTLKNQENEKLKEENAQLRKRVDDIKKENCKLTNQIEGVEELKFKIQDTENRLKEENRQLHKRLDDIENLTIPEQERGLERTPSPGGKYRCKCKTDCSTGMCGCKRRFQVCGACACAPHTCINRERN